MSQQRTILVTGSSSGIGAAIVDRLLADGHKVIGIARRPQAHRPESRFTAVSLDLSDVCKRPEQLARVVQEHPQIDAVVSNAGDGLFEPLDNLSPKQINEFFNLNLL